MLGRNLQTAPLEKEYIIIVVISSAPFSTKEFEDQEKEIEKAAAEERERRKELGMDFDKAPGQIL